MGCELSKGPGTATYKDEKAEYSIWEVIVECEVCIGEVKGGPEGSSKTWS